MRVTTLTLFICCFVSAEHRQLPVGKSGFGPTGPLCRTTQAGEVWFLAGNEPQGRHADFGQTSGCT